MACPGWYDVGRSGTIPPADREVLKHPASRSRTDNIPGSAMTSTVSMFVYFFAIPLWLVLWWTADGFSLLRRNRMLYLPLLLCVAYLLINGVLILAYGAIGEMSSEEERFYFIGERAQIAVQATASVLIVATIVYGLSIKQVPVSFVRFMVYSFVTILGMMAPLVWVPIEVPELMYFLRHLQTVALTYGLFFCVAGIVVLLRDLLDHKHLDMDLPSFSELNRRP